MTAILKLQARREPTDHLWDDELERVALGWMLSANATERQAGFGFFRPEHMGAPGRPEVVETILAVHAVTGAVALGEIALRLRERRKGLADAADTTLTELTGCMERYDAAGMPAWQHLVPLLEDWRLQRLVHRSRTVPMGATGRESVERVRAVLREADESIGTGVPDFADEAARLTAFYEGDKPATIATGLANLDEQGGGFSLGDLVVVGARPSVGKTAFALRLARGVIETTRRPVLYLSLEMSAPQLVNRIVADLAGVPNWRVQRANYRHEEERVRAFAALRLATERYQGKLFIRTASARWDEHVAAIERHMAAQPQTAMIVIDYIGLVRGAAGGSDMRRHQELGEITHTLKALAGKYGNVALAVSQLNRSVGNRPPTMDQLRESGDIEQDADVILLLHATEEDEATGGGEAPTPLAVYKRKDRNGEQGTLVYSFTRAYQRIEPARVRA